MRPSAQVVGAAPVAQVSEQPLPLHEHFASFAQLAVHDPAVHTIVHVALFTQETADRLPTFTSHVAELMHDTVAASPAMKVHAALLAHDTLAPGPIVPPQLVELAHETVVLSAPLTVHFAVSVHVAEHPPMGQVCVQVLPLGQVQAVPTQAQPWPEQIGEEPQAVSTTASESPKKSVSVFILESLPGKLPSVSSSALERSR